MLNYKKVLYLCGYIVDQWWLVDWDLGSKPITIPIRLKDQTLDYHESCLRDMQ